MKHAFTLVLLSVAVTVHAAPSKVEGFPITNARLIGADTIDEAKVIRGGEPLGKAEVLVEAGVSEVIIFKNETNRAEVTRETEELIEAGLKSRAIHHIPFQWRDVEDMTAACEQAVEALEILERAANRAGEGKIFFHCTAGEDRTGLLAGLYRVLSEQADADAVFDEEMCAMGYADGNRGKPTAVTSQVHKNLTPLYFTLAAEIAERGHELKGLKRACATLEFDAALAKRKCR